MNNIDTLPTLSCLLKSPALKACLHFWSIKMGMVGPTVSSFHTHPSHAILIDQDRPASILPPQKISRSCIPLREILTSHNFLGAFKPHALWDRKSYLPHFSSDLAEAFWHHDNAEPQTTAIGSTAILTPCPRLGTPSLQLLCHFFCFWKHSWTHLSDS